MICNKYSALAQGQIQTCSKLKKIPLNFQHDLEWYVVSKFMSNSTYNKTNKKKQTNLKRETLSDALKLAESTSFWNSVLGFSVFKYSILIERKCLAKVFILLNSSHSVVLRKTDILEIYKSIHSNSPFLIFRFPFSWSISFLRWRRKSRFLVLLRNNFSVVVILEYVN